MRQTLKKSEILRGRNAFQDVLAGGRRVNGTVVRCTYTTGILSDVQPAKPAGVTAGFAVSRKVRRAVDRNRVRRLMKEAYRTNKEQLVSRFLANSRRAAIVFLYTPSTGKPLLPTYREVVLDIQSILTAILKNEHP